MPLPFDEIEVPDFAKKLVDKSAYIYKINRLTYWDWHKSDQEITGAIPQIFPGLAADGTELEISLWLVDQERLFNAVCAELDRNRGGHGQKIPLIWFTEGEIHRSGVRIRPLREGKCLIAAPQHVQAFLSFSNAHELLQRLREEERAAQHVPAPLVDKLLLEQTRISCRWVNASDCQCEAA